MSTVTGSKKSFTVKAYVGDVKTLLAFNISDPKSTKNLAGFTIECQPHGKSSYYLFNDLQFANPAQHTQVATEPANSTVNAPIQRFRWVHVLGATHQGTHPATGSYTYTVTPRFFDGNNSMQPINPLLSVSVKVSVGPFTKMGLSVGFTRGFMQSQAFTHQFGLKALLQPPGSTLLFDTSQKAGTNAKGESFTYADEYAWAGFSARSSIFDLLNGVLNDSSLRLDMFAYDLNEPDVLGILLKLAAAGRVRIILDNASLHHSATKPTREDQFASLFEKAAKGGAAILRGKFGRFAHDKVLIVSKAHGSGAPAPVKVLTGSTNFSVTGLYVNANHVLVFDDPAVAARYSDVFNESWKDKVSESFSTTALAAQPFHIKSAATPQTTITFSPHTQADSTKILAGISARIGQESTASGPKNSVLFAVMQLTGSQSPVYSTLTELHAKTSVFSYGISDSPGGVTLYKPGNPQGLLVTGKPGKTTLPPPFDQVPSIAGHEIHDKFVVCGFNGSSPVVYCGSSNLASGGEALNGDNLIAVEDGNVATAFAIEALLLVDHYNFLDHFATKASAAPGAKKLAAGQPRVAKQPRSKQAAALAVGMYLASNDSWAASYYSAKDLHRTDRLLFG
jgi:PLD-like domain